MATEIQKPAEETSDDSWSAWALSIYDSATQSAEEAYQAGAEEAAELSTRVDVLANQALQTVKSAYEDPKGTAQNIISESAATLAPHALKIWGGVKDLLPQVLRVQVESAEEVAKNYLRANQEVVNEVVGTLGGHAMVASVEQYLNPEDAVSVKVAIALPVENSQKTAVESSAKVEKCEIKNTPVSKIVVPESVVAPVASQSIDEEYLVNVAPVDSSPLLVASSKNLSFEKPVTDSVPASVAEQVVENITGNITENVDAVAAAQTSNVKAQNSVSEKTSTVALTTDDSEDVAASLFALLGEVMTAGEEAHGLVSQQGQTAIAHEDSSAAPKFKVGTQSSQQVPVRTLGDIQSDKTAGVARRHDGQSNPSVKVEEVVVLSQNPIAEPIVLTFDSLPISAQEVVVENAVAGTAKVDPRLIPASAQGPVTNGQRSTQSSEGDLVATASDLTAPLENVHGGGNKSYSDDRGHDRPTEQMASLSEDMDLAWSREEDFVIDEDFTTPHLDPSNIYT